MIFVRLIQSDGYNEKDSYKGASLEAWDKNLRFDIGNVRGNSVPDLK